MKVLVSIANHGNGNWQYLKKVLGAYRKMPIDVTLVVLSNIPKHLGDDIEVIVGVPSKNPWSLPFAHRTLFRERINDYDYFVYSEDDTLLSWTVFESFTSSINDITKSEIAGFLRTELSPNGEVYYSTCHGIFRWIPSSVRRRGKDLWAKYSNDHSACFVASQEQLRLGIESGGFPIEPHEGRFDMLCSAATDLYTSCGFEHLINIDQIENFSLPHLPNKYIGKMGLPAEELQWQIGALKEIFIGNYSAEELLEPETLLPGCFGSKRYREEPDPVINQMLDSSAKNILVWGAGEGIFEADLQSRGFNVSVYPLNAVMGECCRQRGLNVLPINGKVLDGDRNQFDTVILRDVIHLIDTPESVLEEVRELLRNGGRILIRVPNFYDIRLFKRRLIDSRYRGKWNRKRIGATPFNGRSLIKLVQSTGFGNVELKKCVSNRLQKFDRLTLGLFSQNVSSGFYLRGMKV